MKREEFRSGDYIIGLVAMVGGIVLLLLARWC